MNSSHKKAQIEKLISFPEDYQLVSESREKRNHVPVTILRYQKSGNFVFNGPRIIAVFQEEELISLKNLTDVPTGTLPSAEEAQNRARDFARQANKNYAEQLSFLRIEKQQRDWIDGKKALRVPVLWVKFAHPNGSYNWVTLGPDQTLIELEFDSHWDYFRGRRKTEMWDNDDWVLARNGKGPQLPSPNALA